MGLLDRDYFVEESLRRQGILKPGETLRPPNRGGEKTRVSASWMRPSPRTIRKSDPRYSQDEFGELKAGRPARAVQPVKPVTGFGAAARIVVVWVLIGACVHVGIKYLAPHRPPHGVGRSPGKDASPPAARPTKPAGPVSPATTT